MSERSSNEHGKPTTKPRSFRRRRLIEREALVTLLAVIATVSVVIYLVRSEPAYWKEHQQFLRENSPEQIEALAGQVEDKLRGLANLGLEGGPGLIQTMSQPPGSPADTQDQTATGGDTPTADAKQPKIKPEDVHINTEQTLKLNNEQLAAVVQTRTEEWMKDRGYVMPNEIKDPMITIEDGKLVMAFRFVSARFTAVISGKFNLNILDNGMAELRLNRFYIGKLPSQPT